MALEPFNDSLTHSSFDIRLFDSLFLLLLPFHTTFRFSCFVGAAAAAAAALSILYAFVVVVVVNFAFDYTLFFSFFR